MHMREPQELGSRKTTMEPTAPHRPRPEEQPQGTGAGFLNHTVYHGLLEPIQSISGYLELILDGKVPDVEQRNQFLAIAYREAMYLASRLNDLLLASSIEAGELEIEVSPFSMTEAKIKVYY